MNRHFSEQDTQKADRYTNRCSASLIVRGHKLKPQCYGTSTSITMPFMKSKQTKRTNAREAVENRGYSYADGENVNQYSYCGKQFWGFVKTSKTELPYDWQFHF